MNSKLEDEISGDPTGQNYVAMTDTEFLTNINAADLPRNRTSMTGREVKAAVDVTEYKALSDAKKQMLLELVKRDDLDLFGIDKDILLDIFGSGSTTGTNLVTARVEMISRGAKIEWGEVTMRDLRQHTLSRKTLRA